MIDFEINIRLLERVPVWLVDNGSVVIPLFLAEVRKRMKSITIDLASMSIEEVYDEVLALEDDVMPIFLVPKRVRDIDKSNLIHFMLKREEYGFKERYMEFEKLRYLVVAKERTIDDANSGYCHVTFGVVCYSPELLTQLRMVGSQAVGMTQSGAVKAYRFAGVNGEEDEDVSAVAADIARKMGLQRSTEWDQRMFYQEIFNS